MRRLFVLLLAVGVVPVRVAHAQSDTGTFVFRGGDLGIEWLQPSEQQDGRIDCEPTPNNTECKPLNLQACTEEVGGSTVAEGPGREIKATLSRGNALVAANAKLWVWVDTDTGPTGRCSRTADEMETKPLLMTYTVPADSPLVTGNGVLIYPDGFGSGTPRVTTRDLMRGGSASFTVVKDACATSDNGEVTGLQQIYRLCFGVVGTGTGTGGEQVQSADKQAWLRIPVDTAPPPAFSSLTATPLDGRLELAVATATKEDFSRYLVLTKENPDVNAPALTCAGIVPTAVPSEFEITLEPAPSTSATFAVSGTNGFLLQGCAAVYDLTGNAGAFTPFQGVPQNECDFIECFPGDLEGGYCAAIPGGSAFMVVVVAFLGVRRRRPQHKEERS